MWCSLSCPVGEERSWHLARTIIGGLALSAAIAHIVVLAVVFHVSGITPFMLTLMVHVALGLLSHRFALHALPPLRVGAAVALPLPVAGCMQHWKPLFLATCWSLLFIPACLPACIDLLAILAPCPSLQFCFFVDTCFWVLDVTIGACLLSIVSIMCIGGILTRVQAVLLFSTDYAK
jgi:hypothetical protein